LFFIGLPGLDILPGYALSVAYMVKWGRVRQPDRMTGMHRWIGFSGAQFTKG